jgi:hypothetical protein
MKKLFFLLLLVGCGVKITPKPVVVGPDFESGYAQCKNIYKNNEEKVEQCFEDFRNFLNVTVKLDTSVVIKFCDDLYEAPSSEFSECVQDLISILKKAK